VDATCFACHSSPGVVGGPRALCPQHKQGCTLPDGSLLSATLALVTTEGGQLEDSSLGWLYNPVFVVNDQGDRCQAWTSFVGGGMAVLEDRFGATDPFEFWMCERDDMVTLLAAVSSASEVREPRTVLENLPQPAREALSLAYRTWRWSRQVAERHHVLGDWPRSFEQLTALLRPLDGIDLAESGEMPQFLECLVALAHKRLSRQSPSA
jgi:hypothetical protein